MEMDWVSDWRFRIWSDLLVEDLERAILIATDHHIARFCSFSAQSADLIVDVKIIEYYFPEVHKVRLIFAPWPLEWFDHTQRHLISKDLNWFNNEEKPRESLLDVIAISVLENNFQRLFIHMHPHNWVIFESMQMRDYNASWLVNFWTGVNHAFGIGFSRN